MTRLVQLRFETFRSFLKPIEKTSEYPPDSQLNFVFSTSLRSFARMVGSYAKIAFKSSSGVVMGRTSNSRTSTSNTPGDTNAGRVGPR